jgi:Right handed beta helix region
MYGRLLIVALLLSCSPVDAADGGLDAAGLDAAYLDASGIDAGAEADAGLPAEDAAGADGGVRDVIGVTGTVFTSSGQVIVTSGMTVTGLHITSTTGPCIIASGVHDVRITNNRIGPCGPDAEGVGINLEDADTVRVDHNEFDDVASALYVYASRSDLVFDHNRATRIRGPFPRGQLVQFNAVSGSGNRIVCNISDQTVPGYLAGPEDHVNMFASSGTAESPVVVAFNRIRGGGPSGSGGGLLAGDNTSAYIDVTDNVLVDPGQYGLAIAGGTHIRLLRNRIYSGDVHSWSNVGLYLWNQSEPQPCSDHEVRGNQVFYAGPSGPNPAWNADNCGPVAGWDENVFGDATLDAAMFDVSLPQCE